MDEANIQRSKTEIINSDTLNLKEIEKKETEEERLKEKKAAYRQNMMEKQKAAKEKKQAFDDKVQEYDAIVDKMNAKAEVLQKAGRLLGDSFAMDMVKKKLNALKDIRDRKDIPEEEKQARLHIAMYDLEAVCVRYRSARYKGKEPLSIRHRIVDSILQDATVYIDKRVKLEPDVSINYDMSRKELKEVLKQGGLDKIRSGVEAIEKLLCVEMSLDKAEFEKQQAALTKSYRNVIDRMNEYVADTSRVISSSKNKYRVISDALLQMNLEYNKIFGLTPAKLKDSYKAGYTWENIINTRGRIITPVDMKKQKDMLVNAGESDAKMTALYRALGSNLCLNYETAEKVGKNKKGGIVRKKVSVAEGKGKYLTKADILAAAAEKRAEVIYNRDVIFGLTKIQLIDMIAGVKNRKDDSLCFKYREIMKMGRKVFEVYDVKVMFTKGGFTGEKAEAYNNNRTGKFNRIHKDALNKEDRVMTLWAYDLDFADKLRATDPDKIIEALNGSGVKMDAEEKAALKDRMKVLKETLDIDRLYGSRSRAQPLDSVPDTPTAEQNKEGADIVYTAILRQNSEAITLLDKKLTEGHINKTDKKETKEKKDEELSDNELFVKKANSAHKQQSISGMKRKSAKRSLANDAISFINSYSKNPSPEMKDIRDLITEYTNIHATASDIEERLFSEQEQINFNIEMDFLNSRMIEIDNLFDENAEKDGFEEDGVIDLSEFFAEPKIEKNKVAGGLQRIHDERMALINIVFRIRYLQDKLISGKLDRTEQERKKELRCLESLERLFNFTKGNLVVPEDAQIISDDGITYIDKNKNKKTELNLTMVDTSAVPLFEHEPCIEDVKQGGLGDCYFLATVAAIVENNPKDIKDMMRDNGDTVTVRLFDRKGRPKYLNIKKSIPMDASNNWSETFARGAYWVQYLEKAYTLLNPHGRKNERDQRNYENIAGGWASIAFKNLTGKDSDEFTLDNVFSMDNRKKMYAEFTDEEIRAKYGKTIKKVIEVIREKKRLKLPVTAATKYMIIGNGGLNGERIGRGIAATHEYTVLGVEEVNGREMIKLRNPWGFGAMHYEIQEGSDLIVTKWRDNRENGAFYISPERFVAYFNRITGVKMDNMF